MALTFRKHAPRRLYFFLRLLDLRSGQPSACGQRRRSRRLWPQAVRAGERPRRSAACHSASGREIFAFPRPSAAALDPAPAYSFGFPGLPAGIVHSQAGMLTVAGSTAAPGTYSSLEVLATDQYLPR